MNAFGLDVNEFYLVYFWGGVSRPSNMSQGQLLRLTLTFLLVGGRASVVSAASNPPGLWASEVSPPPQSHHRSTRMILPPLAVGIGLRLRWLTLSHHTSPYSFSAGGSVTVLLPPPPPTLRPLLLPDTMMLLRGSRLFLIHRYSM